MTKRKYPSRTCIICGDEFNREKGERSDNYQVRVTCGDECRTEAKRRAAVKLHDDESALDFEDELTQRANAEKQAWRLNTWWAKRNIVANAQPVRKPYGWTVQSDLSRVRAI